MTRLRTTWTQARRALLPAQRWAVSGRGGSHRAFTLVELLTVVAIISLLMGILMPTLSKAREQAKRARVLALVEAIGKSLEAFANDFGDYPDSSMRRDIINWDETNPGPPQAMLSGAHWLARALMGHDRQGVDAQGIVMKGYVAMMPQPKESDLKTYSRKGPYFEGNVIVRDNDQSNNFNIGSTTSTNDYQPTGRLIIIDDLFRSPILYYRANERAKDPFCVDGLGQLAPGNPMDRPGVYRQADNRLITGDGTSVLGWDFGFKDRPHQISKFGNVAVDPNNLSVLGTIPPGYTNTFVNYFKSNSALRSSQIAKPVTEKFILISAGKDGLYGTGDDITNFNQ